jgi:hypothetical protein
MKIVNKFSIRCFLGSLWTPLRYIHLPFIPNLLRWGRRYAVPTLREDGEFPANSLNVKFLQATNLKPEILDRQLAAL